MGKFKKGCPGRPYAKYAAEPRRPAYCPCAWTQWKINLQFKGIMAEDTMLAVKLSVLIKLFAE